MRLEIFVLGVTAFFIYNAYNDGKYLKLLLSFKKYYTMIFYALLGVGIYLLLKRNPSQGQKMLLYANNLVKFMPIDKSSLDMLSPIFDFTTSNEDSYSSSFMGHSNGMGHSNNPIQKMSEHAKASKRSVSETKKKYVAAQQDWKCGQCKSQLDHTYEIDHRIRLEYGGGNDVQNLVALCRNCHGKKTASENM
jgi:hypothetical protein